MPESPAGDEFAARAILAAWPLSPRGLHRLHSGLINATWRVEVEARAPVILQRLHSGLPPEVNLNIAAVTRWLADRRHLTPRLHATRRGELWQMSGDTVWRVMDCIDGESFHALPSVAHAVTAGRMLADFHAALDDFSAPLPWQRAPVHVPARHREFLQQTLVTRQDHPQHAAVLALADALVSALDALPPLPLTPMRLLHGDPKLSNLLFGPAASPRCLVDLDTLAFATLPFELGDALRSWCNPLPEDATEGRFQFDFLEGAIAGYAERSQGFITRDEVTSIVTATETIFIELAMRFAADTLNESYFGWDPQRFESRAAHNLLRAQNQWRCAQLLGAERARAEALVSAAFGVSA